MGQDNMPKVFANGGSVGIVGNTEISFTIGEPLVQTANLFDLIVSQGFQQPFFLDNCPVFIPNAFTPYNDDGLNEYFKPVYDCDIEVISFLIYDRWGKLVFNSNDLSLGWDGTAFGETLEMGVFSWHFAYQNREGLYTKPNYKQGIVHLLK